jgi:hypothetical protein
VFSLLVKIHILELNPYQAVSHFAGDDMQQKRVVQPVVLHMVVKVTVSQ